MLKCTFPTNWKGNGLLDLWCWQVPDIDWIPPQLSIGDLWWHPRDIQLENITLDRMRNHCDIVYWAWRKACVAIREVKTALPWKRDRQMQSMLPTYLVQRNSTSLDWACGTGNILYGELVWSVRNIEKKNSVWSNMNVINLHLESHTYIEDIFHVIIVFWWISRWNSVNVSTLFGLQGIINDTATESKYLNI